MIGAVQLVVASGGGQCLAVNGCHAYGPRIVGIIVGGAVAVTFIVIAVRLWRKSGNAPRQEPGIVGLTRSGSAARVEQVIEELQSGKTTVVVSSSDGVSRSVSGDVRVQRRAKLEELHRRGALTDEEFAQQMALLKSAP